jgi:hypothetical protein
MSEFEKNRAPNPGSAVSGIESQRSAVVAWSLGLFLGILGIDRFYLGKHNTGALKLLTAGGFWIWWLIDLVSYIRGKALDIDNRPLANYPSSPKGMIIGSIVAISPVLVFITWVILNAEPVA